MANNEMNDDEILPDFTEASIKGAAATQQAKLGYYRWRVTGATKDVSNPEKQPPKGLLMVVLDHTALKEVSSGTWQPVSKPTTKRWLILPRAPSAGILRKKGYSENQIVTLLGDAERGIPATFDDNGPNNLYFNQFRSWARAAYPGSFAAFPMFDKATGIWTYTEQDGAVKTLGSGDDAAAQASEIKRRLVAEIKDFAGKLWQDPKLAVGCEYYDEYRLEAPKEGKPAQKYPNLAGYPRRPDVTPKNKDGAVIPVIGAAK